MNFLRSKPVKEHTFEESCRKKGSPYCSHSRFNSEDMGSNDSFRVSSLNEVNENYELKKNRLFRFLPANFQTISATNLISRRACRPWDHRLLGYFKNSRGYGMSRRIISKLAT